MRQSIWSIFQNDFIHKRMTGNIEYVFCIKSNPRRCDIVQKFITVNRGRVIEKRINMLRSQDEILAGKMRCSQHRHLTLYIILIIKIYAQQCIVRYRVYMYILIINMSKINNGSACGSQRYLYTRLGANNIVN